MTFIPASPATLAAFVVIVSAVIAAILAAIHHAWRGDRPARATIWATLFLGVWLAAQSALVASGRMTSMPMNGLPFFFGPIVLVCAGLGLSPVGRRLAETIPLAALVGFQAFRLPLELVLHDWVTQGVIPGSMTWTGQNWDIFSGLLALVAAPLAGRFRIAARIANIMGFALLLNVMRVALLSAPVPFGWNVQPTMLLAFHLPYALIGPVCVGGALFGHIVLTRRLWRRQT